MSGESSKPQATAYGNLLKQLTEIAHWADMIGRSGYANVMRQARDTLARADTLRGEQVSQRQSDNARIAQLEQQNTLLREKLAEAGLEA